MLYPNIGIPMTGKGMLHHFAQYPYIRCLQRAGATVQALMLHASEGAVATALDKCDGFLFPGGPDIRPELYGQLRQPGCRGTDEKRDHFEMLLLRAAIGAYKPLFCIGRGMQLLNVAAGGTLMQDIRVRQEYPHDDFWHRASATHPVELDMGSQLEYLFDADTVAVNSLHHQSIDELGTGLFATADSPEGFAEALEMEDYPFCLAVQWHPEYMAPRTPAQQRLFQAFVEACRQPPLTDMGQAENRNI